MKYPSDLTEKQWELIKGHFDKGNYGKSRKHSQKDLVSAVFYIMKTGCQWRFYLKTIPLIKQFIVFINEQKIRGSGRK